MPDVVLVPVLRFLDNALSIKQDISAYPGTVPRFAPRYSLVSCIKIKTLHRNV